MYSLHVQTPVKTYISVIKFLSSPQLFETKIKLSANKLYSPKKSMKSKLSPLNTSLCESAKELHLITPIKS